MTLREAVLDAFVRLERRHGRATHQLAEIIHEVRTADPGLLEASVRTSVVSVMCKNAPVHHQNHTDDLERVGRGLYRRLVPWPPSTLSVATMEPASPEPDVRARRTRAALAHDHVDIEGNVTRYLSVRGPTGRYASFDYCFNYFQAFREAGNPAGLVAPENLETSCLQLGFYLASWGMLRGSTALLQRSSRHLVPVIEVIATTPEQVWATDADAYTTDARRGLLDTAARIAAALSDGASDTLTTKIMLGVFGNVPAYDTYFKHGFGVRALTDQSLRLVGAFGQEHFDLIERLRQPTIDFLTSAQTERLYTRAKVIDMVFFIEGSSL